MGSRMKFTKPERARLAKKAAAMIAEVTGQAAEFVPCEFDAGEVRVDLNKYVTVCGSFRWVNFTVTPRGLDVHIAFDEVEKARDICAGMNPYSGKWNHYLWPSDAVPKAEREPLVLRELHFILKRLQPV